MTVGFKDTPEWQLGRRGEILQIATLARFGFSVLDVGGSTNDKAPFLHHFDANFVAPDAMAFKTGKLWMEFKTKGRHNSWRGGSSGDVPRVPPRIEEGIDRSSYEHYLHTQRSWKTPVVLLVLSIKEGELLGNTIASLGEPRYSPNLAYDIVNWDIFKFRRLCQFDCARLRKYFYNSDGAVRRAPDDMPSARELRQVLDWLRPAQGDIDLIMQDIVSQMEVGWHT